jgi:cytochrome P450
MNEAPLARLDAARFFSDPGGTVAALYAQHGPVFRTRLPNGSFVYVLVGPEANRVVLGTDRGKFSNELGWQRIQRAGEVFGRGLTFLDGAEHALHRKLMAPHFRIDRAWDARPVVERVVEQETAGWVNGQVLDLFESFYRITFCVAAEFFLGITDHGQIEELIRQFRILEPLGTVGLRREQRLAAEKDAIARLRELLHPLLQLRRTEPVGDLLSHMASARDPQGRWLLDDDALHAEANQMLLAGHLSTSSLLAWLAYLLLRHPGYLARIGEDDVLRRVMLEAERLYPPVGHLPRVTVEDVEVAGCVIPKGSFVACSAVGGHRIPGIFAEPERFDPERFAPPREEHLKTPYALVGFSAGPRQCLGIHFAKAQIEIVVRTLFSRFRMELVDGREVVCRYQPLATPVGGVRVRVARRDED